MLAWMLVVFGCAASPSSTLHPPSAIPSATPSATQTEAPTTMPEQEASTATPGPIDEPTESSQIRLALRWARVNGQQIRVSVSLESSPSPIAVTTHFVTAFDMLSLRVVAEDGSATELHQTYLSPALPHMVWVATDQTAAEITFVAPAGMIVKPGLEVEVVGRLNSPELGPFELRSNSSDLR